MNLVGRQMQRTGAAAHHQRQYSDNFMEAPSKWLQSTGPPQEYGVYVGEGGVGSKWNRNLQRSLNAGNEWSLDPPSPMKRSSSLRKAGDDSISPNEYSPGLLDLHSFDTELVPEIPACGKILDDLEPYPAPNKNANRANPVAKIKVVVCTCLLCNFKLQMCIS